MTYDLIIIGSGPGGYVAAIRASQLGLKTAVVEREALGGICLNWGCIPTKALLKSAQIYEDMLHAADFGISVHDFKPDFPSIVKRSRQVADGMNKGVNFLMKKNKIDVIKGSGKITKDKIVQVADGNGNVMELTAQHVIIAVGGRSRELPNLEIDGKTIIGYRQAMSLQEKPQSMVIVGSGAIGSEFAYFYQTLGTKVTLVEMLPNILPLEDGEVSQLLERSFKKMGMEVITDATVEGVDTGGRSCSVRIKRKNEIIAKECDVVLSAVGMKANLEGIGIDETGIATDSGKILTDKFYRTNITGFYAIGDCIVGPALAHVASAEGIICVENIAGKNPEPLNYLNIPSCTYCRPEVASVGYTEKAAKEAGFEIKVGKFPFSASGKASGAGHKEGFVKLIFDAKYGELLGGHLIGYNVTELVGELVAVRKLEATGHEIIKTMHPHPTMSEAIMEAAAAAYGEVIHL